MPGPVRGRRQLMEATQANLEPIFLLYEGGPADARPARARPARGGHPGRDARSRTTGTPVLSADTGDGIRHTLWAVTDPAALAEIAADLAPRQALIADGNHRYAAYLQMQADRRAAGEGPGPWDYGLALLVDGDAFAPEIGAIHRVLPGLPPAEAVERAKAGFSVRAMPGGTAALPAALDALAAAGQDGPGLPGGRAGPGPPAHRPGSGAARGGHARGPVGGLAPAVHRGAAGVPAGGAVGHPGRRAGRAGRAPRRGRGPSRRPTRPRAARRSSATRCAPRTCTRSRPAASGCPASPPRSRPSREPAWS